MWGTQGWNQWALQPAMFNDVPHEQIDWAELAKQWIQMQQTQPAEAVSAPAPMPPPPPQTVPPVTLPPPPGHIPLITDEFVDGTGTVPVPAPASPLLKTPVPPAVIPEPFHPERTFESENAPFVPPKTSDNTFWTKSQWEASAAGDVDERVWPVPPIESAAALIGGKETFDYGHMHDNPPLAMQSIDYNHMSEFSYNQVYPTPAPVPETHYDQYWSQVSAAPTISPIFLKKERSTTNLQVEEESTHIDAAKRKQLPAWIRDGLEKMEQERLKRLEKERAAKEKAEKIAKSESLKKELDLQNSSTTLVPSKSKFDSESEEEEEEERTERIVQKNSPIEKSPPSPVEDLRTEEEKKQELMLKVRRMLTEVLLSVTNSEMLSIAQEMYKKAMSKAPARQLASSSTLSSVASGLRGLASYGTESEASEEEDQEKSDSEEELYRKIKEKKKLFAAKERKIIADLERKEREEKLEAEKLHNEKNSEKNVNKDSIPSEKANDVSNDMNQVEKSNHSEEPDQQISEIKPEEDIDVPENINDSTLDKSQNEDTESLANIKTIAKKEESYSSDTSSSSSDSDSESGDRHTSKTHRENKKVKSEPKKVMKKDKISTKHESRRKRSKSRDSDSSGKTKRERSRDKNDRKNSNHKKRKKYKRSDSSSSSNSSYHRKRHSSKYESVRNHRERRSRSYDDRERKHKRSISPSRNHRKSDNSYSYHSSRSHRYDDDDKYKKHREEKKYREYRKSPSPYHSSRLPRKYRSSRSLSSESESSGKKSKKSRNR